ncbi:MAG TPA: acetyl-CoA carboxylase biotin carboxyl carrier protein, partial [Candidatus Hydrogenedentes bacterium]|nr:acetyl-CoA carboxylase biotin carboxyl carrier protein [Candidatus Hydrogenedentota bacterium]
MDLERIQEVIRMFEASAISEMELEEEGLRMRLKKQHAETIATAAAPAAQPPQSPTAPVAATIPDTILETAPTDEAGDDGLVTIDSPMVGTFFAAPGPGDPAFVKPGDRVDEGQTVCIVEAMKLMNEVVSEFPAVIVKVLVENAEPVEY